MEENELLIPVEIVDEVPDYSFKSKDELIEEYGLLPYNIFLYNKRKEEKLSRYQFSKKLGISYFRYSYIEKGVFKPSKKEIKKISKALDMDFSIYLEGLASYPIGLMVEEEEPKKRRILKSKAFRITLISLLSIFIITYIISRIYNLHITSFTRHELNTNYITLIDGVSKSEDFTYTISGSFTRPMIYERVGSEYTSITGEYTDSPFQLDFQYTIYENDYRVTYSTALKKMYGSYMPISITYVDYINYDTYFGRYYYQVETGFKKDYMQTTTGSEVLDTIILERVDSNIINFNTKIEELIHNKLNLNVSIANDVLPVVPIMEKTNRLGYISLLIFLISLVFIVVSSILLTYSFISGKEKHSEALLSELDYEDQIIDCYTQKKEVPKDIRFGPFIPEVIYQIIGGIFTVGSVIASIAYIILNIIGKDAMFSNMGLNSGMTLLVTGIFLMLFVDFDIYFNDRRVLRNVFIYGIIFFFIYNIQVLVINALTQISLGALILDRFNLRLPNYFGSIALYFLIMVFLFTNPKFANTKRKLYIYRSCAIIPILFIMITTTVSIGYKNFGWQLPTGFLYLIDTAKPQISILVVSYLVGLYFLRNFFKRRYDVQNAVRYFNGNRFLLCKNILILLITIIISLIEVGFMNNPSAKALGFGLYPTFFWLGILLLFHRPHLGKRKRAAERATLVLNTILFGTLYILIAVILIVTIVFTLTL